MVRNAVHPAADRAFLEGAGIGLAHQIEQLFGRRGGVQPVAETVRADDGRLALLDVGQTLAGPPGRWRVGLDHDRREDEDTPSATPESQRTFRQEDLTPWRPQHQKAERPWFP